MMLKLSTQILAVALSLLISAPSPGYQDPESGASAGGAADGAPMSGSELDALVAPIALYPDSLVAQILAAATFPDQVAIASYWLQQNQQLTGSLRMQAVDKQSWDASVKALTQFPTVIANLANNLPWTSSLGEAYHNQAPEVMAAIQRLRAQAKAAGNLKSTPQMSVVQQTPQTIVIQPANPQVVYVPEYNPAVVYGYPYVTPGYTAAAVASGLIGFGAGIALGGGGWNSWNCNWNGGAVVYNHNNFYGNTAWHGGYYNGGYHDGYGYHNALNRTAVNNFHGTASRVNNFNREEDRNLDANRADAWSHDDGAFGRSNAFSGLGDRFGGMGGWASRAGSFRGWGSMRAGGFSGGRFGGGGFHGFGGGGFHGGGFRR
ncbi:MAG TPA: DUF3300 domain-containing protein [Candidatus Solibacter sp.]|jgi:hypothetical protein